MNIPEPDEPHHTYLENAQHKAKYYAQHTKVATLSEDAGLRIEALNGFPGVRTKEFVEECGGIQNAFAKLQAMLKDTDNMSASFICSAAIYIPLEDIWISAEGIDNGRISFPARGSDCFGFDPIYIPNGYDKTNAELGVAVKNQIGHRAKAIRGVLQGLKQHLSQQGVK